MFRGGRLRIVVWPIRFAKAVILKSLLAQMKLSYKSPLHQKSPLWFKKFPDEVRLFRFWLFKFFLAVRLSASETWSCRDLEDDDTMQFSRWLDTVLRCERIYLLCSPSPDENDFQRQDTEQSRNLEYATYTQRISFQLAWRTSPRRLPLATEFSR